MRLESLVVKLGLSEHVRLAGFVADDDLPLYYAASDLFVLPTVALEGFGLATVEALACGTPVIGTPVGATPEILAPLDKRLIAASSKPVALAQAITSFLDEPKPDHLAPDRVSEYARQNYGWRAHVDRTEAVYEELLNRRREGELVAQAGASDSVESRS
jgi:glycosyltransferase involved in cell wall biosynthesis